MRRAAMRGLLTLGLPALLGACVLPAGGSVGLPVRSLALYDAGPVVAGPENYCIDTALSRPASGFAVLAGCALISEAAVLPTLEGLITVQVGAAGSAAVAGNEQAMVRLLQSPAGIALLSEAGRPETVRVDALESRRGLVRVHFTDSAAPPVTGLESAEWRAFLDIGDRLTTISVRGLARAPLSETEGRRLLTLAVDALRVANDAATTDETE